MSRSSLTLFALMAAILAIGAHASVAGATVGPVTTPVNLTTCATAAPHASIAVNGPVTTASSNGNGYFYSPQGLCARYVVSVTLPTSGQYVVSIGPSIQPTTKATCEALTGDAAVYAKPFLATSSSLVAFAHFTGSWVGATLINRPFCKLIEDSGTPAFTSDVSEARAGYVGNGAFGLSLRVAVGMKLDDWQSVTVSAAPYTPPQIPH